MHIFERLSLCIEKTGLGFVPYADLKIIVLLFMSLQFWNYRHEYSLQWCFAYLIFFLPFTQNAGFVIYFLYVLSEFRNLKSSHNVWFLLLPLIFISYSNIFSFGWQSSLMFWSIDFCKINTWLRMTLPLLKWFFFVYYVNRTNFTQFQYCKFKDYFIICISGINNLGGVGLQPWQLEEIQFFCSTSISPNLEFSYSFLKLFIDTY